MKFSQIGPLIKPSKVKNKGDYLRYWVISWAGLLDSLVVILSFGRLTANLKPRLLFTDNKFRKWWKGES